jgi:hypothetical protein
MQKAHGKLANQIYDARMDVTSDDLSQAMVTFIPKIKDISNMRQADALDLAFDLIWELKDLSYGDLDADRGGYGSRPSDRPADRVLVEFVNRRREAGHVWDWGSDLASLKDQAEHVGDYGIQTWFPGTLQALEALGNPKQTEAEAPAVAREHDMASTKGDPIGIPDGIDPRYLFT